MPHLISPEAFICNRCWTRLLRAARRLRPALQPASSLHSSSRFRDYTEARDQDGSCLHEAPRASRKQPRKRNGDDAPRSQGWRTLLQNKTLGEAASILVLRDTERKKGTRRREAEKQEEQPSAEINAKLLLESLKDQNVDPEQSEVDSNIDGLKPKASRYGELRPSTISQEQYDKALRRLSERFNQTQLARYVTHALEEQSTQVDAEHEDLPLDRRWHPPNGANRKRNVVHRGKKGLADSIIRSVWGFEVEEEVNGQGILEVRLDRKHIALAMLEEKRSTLQEVEQERNINIQVVEAKSLVRIVGPKYISLEAVADIEALLQEPYEQSLELKTYNAIRQQDENLKGPVDRRMIDQVASSLSCQILRSKPGYIVVRGPGKQAVERFQRLLLVQFDLLGRTKDHVLSGLLSRKESGFITQASTMYSTTSQADLDPHGRFTMSFRMAAGEEGGKAKQLLEPDRLPLAIVTEVQDKLKKPAVLGFDPSTERPLKAGSSQNASSWPVPLSTELTTHYTHLLHRLQPGSTVLPISTKDLVRQRKMSPRTSPTISGLPYVLQQLALDKELPTKTPRSRLHIKLVPSPFTYGANAFQGMPTISIDLFIQRRDRQVSIDSVQATLGTRGAHVMLGHLGLDMSVIRREYLTLCEPDADPNLQAFVNSITAHAASSANLFVPLNLRLRVPSYTLIQSALRQSPELQELAKTQDEVEIEYFAVSAQHQTDVVYDHEGQELVYRRSKDMDTGKIEEGVSLQSPKHPRHTVEDSAEAADAASKTKTDNTGYNFPLDLQAFLESSQGMLCRLNSGLGKTRRMDDVLRITERKAREAEEQQRQEAGVGEAQTEEQLKHLVDDEGYSVRDGRSRGGIKVVKEMDK